MADLPGAWRARAPPPAGRQVMFWGHILIDLTEQISCFKLRQNAPVSDLGLKSFSAVPTSENIESIALECNI